VKRGHGDRRAGSIRSTLSVELGPLGAAALRRAHEMVEGGHLVGQRKCRE